MPVKETMRDSKGRIHTYDRKTDSEVEAGGRDYRSDDLAAAARASAKPKFRTMKPGEDIQSYVKAKKAFEAEQETKAAQDKALMGMKR